MTWNKTLILHFGSIIFVSIIFYLQGQYYFLFGLIFGNILAWIVGWYVARVHNRTRVYMEDVTLDLKEGLHTRVILIKYGKAYPEDNLEIARTQGTQETIEFLNDWGLNKKR